MLRSAIANSNHADYDLKNSIERVSYSSIPDSKSTSNSKSENCITKYKLVLHMNSGKSPKESRKTPLHIDAFWEGSEKIQH